MMENRNTLHVFVDSDEVGSDYCDLRNYTNGTAFFVSAVLENGPDEISDEWNSSITLVPIPNNEGLFPTSFTNLFTIICATGSTDPEADRGKQWEYRVAGMLYSKMMHT
jgi:hypothetical protein